MQQVSKLMLSDEEQQLVNDTGWILTKRIIMDKAGELLGLVSTQIQAVMEAEKDQLPDAVLRSVPKIARGENYLLLPYLILDHPRCFAGEDIFAVRTMFWWGNFFSVTLHLAGKYKTQFQQYILEKDMQELNDLFICIHENQWQHHFEAGNYTAVNTLTKEKVGEVISHKPFVKLAMKFPLHSWPHIPVLVNKAVAAMLQLLKN